MGRRLIKLLLFQELHVSFLNMVIQKLLVHVGMIFLKRIYLPQFFPGDQFLILSLFPVRQKLPQDIFSPFFLKLFPCQKRHQCQNILQTALWTFSDSVFPYKISALRYLSTHKKRGPERNIPLLPDSRTRQSAHGRHKPQNKIFSPPYFPSVSASFCSQKYLAVYKSW